MKDVNFRIIKMNEPCALWSGLHESWTTNPQTAAIALMDGHRVEAFAGRQQRRISLTKAFYGNTVVPV